MEEATELLHRLQSEEIPIPQFTSCCPAWVDLRKPSIRTCSSICLRRRPISILSPVIKTYFAQQKNIDPKKIVNISSRHARRRKPKSAVLNSALPASSGMNRKSAIPISASRRGNWPSRYQDENIDFASLEDSKFDKAFGEASGGGRIFGNSGGVMEAAIRTAYHMFTGRPAPKDFIAFEPVRGLQGVKKATVIFGHFVLHVAAISGLGNARAFIDDLIKNDAFEDYSFIEVMACPGGCIGGGGQPKVKLPQVEKKVQEARTASIYKSDEETDIKASWQKANPFVDVPSDSWAYKSVVELADAGIIQGVDGQYFQGNRNITRYEAAEMVAKAMAHMDKASVEQRALINKLADEYADELNNLGVRVTNLENRVGNVKLTGDARIRFQHDRIKPANRTLAIRMMLLGIYRVRVRANAKVNDRTTVTYGISTDDISFADNGRLAIATTKTSSPMTLKSTTTSAATTGTSASAVPIRMSWAVKTPTDSSTVMSLTGLN